MFSDEDQDHPKKKDSLGVGVDKGDVKMSINRQAENRKSLKE